MSESKLQISCVKWFRYQYPELRFLFYHTPNGRMRTASEARILKLEGVVSGVADLTLLVPAKNYHGLFIEIKTPKGRQTPSQKMFQLQVEKQGYKYAICKTLEDFMYVVNNYLNANY